MKTTDMFEHGSPIIKCVPGSLEIDARNAPHGSVTLSNAGSGELIGSITSKSPRLTPSEHSFKGVRFIAEFHADTTAFKEGETENTTVVVTSNGGEIIIPVTVTASAPAVSVKDGRQISSLREFADYAQSEPNLARQLFVKSDFNVWLLKLNYEYMTIYEHFAADPIKERGLDGFLIFNNLKTRSLLVPPTENRIKIEIPPRSKGITQVALPIQREGFGYITATVESDSSWLNIFKTKISSHDFNEDGICNVDIFADSAKFSARRAESKITVTQESGKSFLYSVTAHKIDSYSAELNKTSFNFDDSGYIYIENFSGEEIVVEVYADSPYLKFEGVRYRVRERAQIPFSVKVGRLSLALSGDPFNKQTAIHGNITISTEGRHTALGEIIPEKILSFVIAKPIQER